MARNPHLDLYAILGVHPSAEDIVIRAAFKALAQRYHPDRFNGSMEEAHRRMADLTNAYETLADPARRRKYDRRRGHAGRTAMFYFKNPAREHPLRFGALAARAAAAKQRRYRLAVYVLMFAVVILSAFNLHQHAPQIKDLLTGNHSLPAGGTAADNGSRNSPESAAPEASIAPPSAASVPAAGSVVKGPAIGQRGTRPIGQSTTEMATTPASPATESATTASPQHPLNTVKAPAQPASSDSIKAAESSKATESSKAAASNKAAESNKAAASNKASAAVAAAPATVDPSHKDPKRPSSKASGGASSPAASSPAASSPAASAPEASPSPASPSVVSAPIANPSVTSPPAASDRAECKPAVAALGLCTTNN